MNFEDWHLPENRWL